eukprot:2540995-Prymnesium_polylepis.1
MMRPGAVSGATRALRCRVCGTRYVSMLGSRRVPSAYTAVLEVLRTSNESKHTYSIILMPPPSNSSARTLPKCENARTRVSSFFDPLRLPSNGGEDFFL